MPWWGNYGDKDRQREPASVRSNTKSASSNDTIVIVSSNSSAKGGRVLNRRQFAVGGLASIAFAGMALQSSARAGPGRGVIGYGPLEPDPRGLIDLPKGFTYRIVSQAGKPMDDGFLVPGKFDGMGCFPASDGTVALVRNHELKAEDRGIGPTGGDTRLDAHLLAQPHFGRDGNGLPLPGGTTTIIYDMHSGRTVRQYLSLAGTAVNCAGGITPWGSWLSCEEVAENKIQGPVGRDHGWVFDVSAQRYGLIQPVPLKGLGRFRHEAVAIDPSTGVVYLTEDQEDGLFYRFLPNEPGKLERGGRLQALALRAAPRGSDTRNWESRQLEPQVWNDVFWIDLDGVDNENGDLRMRGHQAGGAIFARGEGIHWGKDELYFTCTDGGAGRIGQVMRYRPSRAEGSAAEKGQPGQLQLFVEAEDPELMSYMDNITIAPWGHLVVCEDRNRDDDNRANQLKGITSEGGTYTIARLRSDTEFAGACFSPDRSTLFVNAYAPGATLAITGPWNQVRTS
jgi:secreted PhoX family phosphatase